jgi:hypothetical protein
MLDASTVALSGWVHPHSLASSYHYEWGRTAGYGNRSAAVRLDPATWQRSAPVTVTGLRRRTDYHYRIVARNAAGTTRGADRVASTR